MKDDKGKGPLKDDKSEVTGIKILDDLEQRVEKLKKFLTRQKRKCFLKREKGKGKMAMKREVIIIEDTDDNPFQVTSDKSSDDRALQLPLWLRDEKSMEWKEKKQNENASHVFESENGNGE
ncbi:hypothetical protein Tco_0077362 [Tanacetum coccineum]